MFKPNFRSIKQKVVLGITFAVLESTVIVGAMEQQQARDELSPRLVDIELPVCWSESMVKLTVKSLSYC